MIELFRVLKDILNDDKLSYLEEMIYYDMIKRHIKEIKKRKIKENSMLQCYKCGKKSNNVKDFWVNSQCFIECLQCKKSSDK